MLHLKEFYSHSEQRGRRQTGAGRLEAETPPPRWGQDGTRVIGWRATDVIPLSSDLNP